MRSLHESIAFVEGRRRSVFSSLEMRNRREIDQKRCREIGYWIETKKGGFTVMITFFESKNKSSGLYATRGIFVVAKNRVILPI